ncbi:MAG: hypothetical protein KH354_05960, partial [Clostridiales bacterium]|nr:hypothetical protein [Clostridiales bacterium]
MDQPNPRFSKRRGVPPFSQNCLEILRSCVKMVTRPDNQTSTIAASAGSLCGTAMLITNFKGGTAYENDRLYLHGLSAKVRHSPAKRADRGS